MMNNESLTTSLHRKTLFLSIDDSVSISDCPYFEIDSIYCIEGIDFPLAVAFVDGAFILCSVSSLGLRALSYVNENFSESDSVLEHLFSLSL